MGTVWNIKPRSIFSNLCFLFLQNAPVLVVDKVVRNTNLKDLAIQNNNLD